MPNRVGGSAVDHDTERVSITTTTRHDLSVPPVFTADDWQDDAA
jgi:hypothetical protein